MVITMTRARAWQREYSRQLIATDFMAIAASVLLGQVLFVGVDADVSIASSSWPSQLDVSYPIVSLCLIALWMTSLHFFATRDVKIIGFGTDEYRRLVDCTLRLFGGVAIFMFLFKWELGRGYFLAALPLGLALLVVSRMAWRRWLRARRRNGESLHRALLVGDRSKSETVMSTIARDPDAGIQVIGALTKGGTVDPDLASNVPILGTFHDVVAVVEALHVDTIIITGSDDLGASEMRRLGWSLEEKDVDVIVAPSLTDIAGPRIHTRPVAGLPLIHVEYPRFEGRKRVSKRAFDVIGSVCLLVLAFPLMVLVAIAVKATSPGPVFYRQERVGLRGDVFGMWKFRSMVVGADDRLKSLLDEQGTSATPLFKINNDPRITPVGAFLRRYSLDELPQFFNVLMGSMSLVGPRPQVAAEVALYDDAARRRLFMKPGITGLWQVSGRSNTSWEDAIRLDLFYVENWSLTVDITILYRTVQAVRKAEGAH